MKTLTAINRLIIHIYPSAAQSLKNEGRVQTCVKHSKEGFLRLINIIDLAKPMDQSIVSEVVES